jgi:hypothetical protein
MELNSLSLASEITLLLLNYRLLVQTCLLPLMDNKKLDVIHKGLKVFMCVTFFVESFDSGTIWENSQELKHWLIWHIEKLLNVICWRVTIYIHDRKLKIILSEFF